MRKDIGLFFHNFRYIIESLDEIDDVDIPSESSDAESLPPKQNAISASSCTSGPSSITSDDVVIEGKNESLNLICESNLDSQHHRGLTNDSVLYRTCQTLQHSAVVRILVHALM
jgi:hypothetical protein